MSRNTNLPTLQCARFRALHYITNLAQQAQQSYTSLHMLARRLLHRSSKLKAQQQKLRYQLQRCYLQLRSRVARKSQTHFFTRSALLRSASYARLWQNGARARTENSCAQHSAPWANSALWAKLTLCAEARAPASASRISATHSHAPTIYMNM